MEIKDSLQKPYTEKQKADFIVLNNHQNGYEIRETEEALEAWGLTEEDVTKNREEYLKTLSMTRSDFFDGMIRAFGTDDSSLEIILEEILQHSDINEMEKMIAMNNYKNALNFYRNHPIFDLLTDREIQINDCLTPKISKEQWDDFFETKKWEYLI